MGTRIRAERLLWPQQTYDGASPPPHNRLYELTHWFVTAVISPACRSTPAMNCRATLLSWYSAPASWKALRSPSKRDRWVCMPEPGWSGYGLGVHVGETPRSRPTSLITGRNVMMLAAQPRASA